MSDTSQIFPMPKRNEAMIELLQTRRSNLAKVMNGPGPSSEELGDILEIAARVPDHRKLAPWRFIIFKGESRERIGQHLGRVFQTQNPEISDDRIMFERERFLRAPIVVGVVSSPVDCPRGTPEWEQRLSSAVVCYNMCLATQAHGYGAQWLTEWYAYDSEIQGELGLQKQEKIAGFIYMGTPQSPSVERARPKVENLITNY